MGELLSLPSELLHNILNLLDSAEPPSVKRLHHVPDARYFSSPDKPLKALRECCNLLHQLVTPMLFQHVVVCVDQAVGSILEVLDSSNVKTPIRSLLLFAPSCLDMHGLDHSAIGKRYKSQGDAAWIACAMLMGRLNPRTLTFALASKAIADLIGAKLVYGNCYYLETAPFQILQLEYNGSTENMPIGYGHVRPSLKRRDESTESDDDAYEHDGHDSSDEKNHDLTSEDFENALEGSGIQQGSNCASDDKVKDLGDNQNSCKESNNDNDREINDIASDIEATSTSGEEVEEEQEQEEEEQEEEQEEEEEEEEEEDDDDDDDDDDYGGLFYLRPWTKLSFNGGSSLSAHTNRYSDDDQDLNPSWITAYENETAVANDIASDLRPLQTLAEFTYIGVFHPYGTLDLLTSVLNHLLPLEILRLRLLPFESSDSARHENDTENHGADQDCLWKQFDSSTMYPITRFMCEMPRESQLYEIKLLDWGANLEVNERLLKEFRDVPGVKGCGWEHDGRGSFIWNKMTLNVDSKYVH